MKKKFINGFLMVAAFVVSATSFVACDDTTEDKIADLHEQMMEQNLTLQDLLNTQVSGLKSQIAALQAELDALEKRQETDSLENNQDIQSLKDAIDSLKNRVTDLENKKNPCDPDGDGACNCDHSKDGSCNCDPNAGTGTGSSCTCTPTDCEWVKDSADIIKRINDANILATEAKGIANAALELAKNDSARIDADSIRIDELTKRVDELEKLRYCWSDSLKTAFDLAIRDSIRIDALEDSLSAEVKRLEELASQNVQLAYAYADKATEVVKTEIQKIIVDSITNVYNNVYQDITVLYEAADKELRADLEDLTKRVTSLETELDNLEGAFNQLITSVLVQGATSPVFGYAALPFNLRSNILAAYYGYAGSNGVEFPTAKPRFYADQDGVKLTSADLKMLGVEAWTKQDGAVIVGDEGNAGTLYLTVNPNTVDFTGVKFQLVNSLDEASAVELSSIAPSDHKLTFGVSRAGNNNAFYEAKATLKGGDENKVKVDLDLNALKDVVKDLTTIRDGVNVTNIASTLVEQLDGVLDANAVKATWTDDLGMTRSTYSHYAVAATAVKPLSYSFGKDFNFTKLPGVNRVENFINSMADQVFGRFENLIPDFSGMKFEAPTINKITIPELNEEDCKITFKVDINTTVKYDLAIDTIIKLDDVVIEDMDGKTSTVKIKVPATTHTVKVDRVIAGVPVQETEDITIPEYYIDVPSTDFTVEGQTVKIKDFKLSIVREIEIPIVKTIESEQNIYEVVNKLYGNIVGSLDGVNQTLEDLDAFMDDVNKVLDELNKLMEVTDKIAEAKDDIKAGLTKYLNIFNNKFCNLINNTNNALQPVMFAKTVGGYGKLSQVKRMPSVIADNSLTLMPTSYTAEILAPAAKKLVGVTNVYSVDGKVSAQGGDADCLAALQAANAQDNIGKVIAGDEVVLNLKLQSGYVYEVAYTAVDFSGVVVANKYYVRTK